MLTLTPAMGNNNRAPTNETAMPIITQNAKRNSRNRARISKTMATLKQQIKEAEVLGKADGFAKGKGGSMHFVDPAIGMMGANGIVGAQVPHAAGLALASKLRHEDRVAITFFGDNSLPVWAAGI